MKEVTLLAALMLSSTALWAQATVTFTFANPALEPARYTLVIHENGAGHYHSEPGSAAGGDANGLQQEVEDRDIVIPVNSLQQIFLVARKQHLFATPCDWKRGKVAFSGTKTLSYQGPEGTGSCSYNYSRVAQIRELTDSLQSIAATLEEGRKLNLLLAHNTLGLEAELTLFSREYEEGHAAGLENIAPVLRQIAASDTVLNHARAQARALLSTAPANKR